MICSSGIGFDPVVDGERLEFGFHGIWQGTAVLYDRKTRSHWLHLSGECVEGPLEGKRLRPIQGRHLLWREWLEEFPSTRVMAGDARFEKHYFPRTTAARGLSYFPRDFLATIQSRDARLPLAALVYGVVSGERRRAYPFAALRSYFPRVVNDQVGETPTLILFDAETGSCSGYGRVLDGRTLQFERTGAGALHETSTDSIFDPAGKCVRGPLQGKQLPALVGMQSEWYGWYATYPDTEVWKP